MPHTRSRRACCSRAAEACGTQIPGPEPGSGPLSRKNAIVGSCSPVRRPSGGRAESAVSGPVLAAHAEGQRMAGFLHHPGFRCWLRSDCPVLYTGGIVSTNVACPPQGAPPPLVQPGLRAITTSVSPGQSQKMPSADRFARSARTSPAKPPRRSPNRCGAEDERDK